MFVFLCMCEHDVNLGVIRMSVMMHYKWVGWVRIYITLYFRVVIERKVGGRGWALINVLEFFDPQSLF